MAKVKINNKCIPIECLETVENYASKTGQTRANVYYHIKNGNIPSVKIGNNSFIVEASKESEQEIKSPEKQEDTKNI